MTIERPDLSQVDPAVRVYVEALEAELDRLRRRERRAGEGETASAPLEPAEPPTTVDVITISAGGIAKRSPRHLYQRQRRGGMGIFDLDTDEDDPPACLTIADESQNLVLITSQARAFRLPVRALPESPVRSRGQSITASLLLRPDERLAVVVPDQGSGYLALVTQRGRVRRFRYHYFGENLRPGTVLYDATEFSPPAAACWTPGDGELFIATRQGRAIRFAERQVPNLGCPGIRLDRDDAVVAVAAVGPDSGVFLVGADGRGTIRLMAGFSANKQPGAGGKTALNTDHLVGAVTIEDASDIFIISRLSKIIRFQAVEVPAKEGVVQGVNCMALRGDEAVAVTSSTPSTQGEQANP
jgi:DNA gyrase subunit A